MDGHISLHDLRPAQPSDVSHPARRPALVVLVDLLLGTIERARSRRILRLLDDRMLRDIGIDRGTARYESEKPFWLG